MPKAPVTQSVSGGELVAAMAWPFAPSPSTPRPASSRARSAPGICAAGRHRWRSSASPARRRTGCGRLRKASGWRGTRGRHANPAAPPFEFLDRAFLSVLNRMGPRVEARLERHGVFPRGGGRLEVDIEPARLRPVEAMDRGALRWVRATALTAGLPEAIASRELRAARASLDWPEDAFVHRVLTEDCGPGNVLPLEAAFEHGAEVVAGFGRFGVRAEALAETAAQRMAGFLRSSAYAGPELADQLLLPFALAGGGCFTTVKPSLHARTAAEVIAAFTDQRWEFTLQADGAYRLSRFS